MLEIWTRKAGGLEWTQWPDLLHGLARLTESLPEEVLLWTDAPTRDTERLRDTLRLVSQGASAGVRVVVASPHPPGDWRESLRGLRVEQFWMVAARHDRRACEITDVAPLDEAVCPALHARACEGMTLSVCGCHHDRMVLARHHLDRWCASGKDGCPHWLARGPTDC